MAVLQKKKKEGRRLNELKSKHDGEGGTRVRKANLSWSTVVHVALEANLKDLCMPRDGGFVSVQCDGCN